MDFPLAVHLNQFQFLGTFISFSLKGHGGFHFHRGTVSILGNIFRKNLEINDFKVKFLAFFNLFLDNFLVSDVRIGVRFLVITGLKCFVISLDRV